MAFRCGIDICALNEKREQKKDGEKHSVKRGDRPGRICPPNEHCGEAKCQDANTQGDVCSNGFIVGHGNLSPDLELVEERGKFS
jgi:hypothetical protein